MNAEEKGTFQHEFDDHLKRKDIAQSHRDTDKFASNNNLKVLIVLRASGLKATSSEA